MTDCENCDTPKPAGYTHLQSRSICNTCLTTFLLVECWCELEHECNYEIRHQNAEHWAKTKQNIIKDTPTK